MVSHSSGLWLVSRTLACMVRPGEMLAVVQYDDYAEVTVLRSCTIRWSVDCTVWHDLGVHEAGSVVTDRDAPRDRPRSYMALVGEERLDYYSRDAAVAFAGLMEPWFG